MRIGIFAGLCWLYTCIHLDRQILAILAESLQSDLGISDSALGALTGSAFSIVYALLGLYFGQVADVANRLAMVRIGALLWSLASIGAAFAPGYAWLIAARAGVAAGEAIATAAAVSLMADLSGDRYRARASSLFFACAFLGAGLAAILGGAVIDYFAHSTSVIGWRAALVAAGLPGIAGALYLSFYRWDDQKDTAPGRSVGFSSVTAVMLAASVLALAAQMRWPPHLGVPAAVLVAVAATAYWAYRLYVVDPSAYGVTLGQASFRWLLLGFAAVLFMDFAASFWLIVFAQREFGLSAAQAGTQLGGLMIVGGIAGSAAGGWIADRWHEKSRAGRVWTALIAALAEAVMIVAAVAQPQYLGFVVAFACFCVSSGGWTGVAAAIGMDIVPRAHLGTAVAAYFLVTTVLGPGLGAFTAGQLADSLGSISNAVTLCCGTIVIALVAFIRLGRTLVSGKREEAKSP